MVNNADKLQKELENFNEMNDGILFKIKKKSFECISA